MRTMATMNQLKRRLHEIVFEADTKYGRLFVIQSILKTAEKTKLKIELKRKMYG